MRNLLMVVVENKITGDPFAQLLAEPLDLWVGLPRIPRVDDKGRQRMRGVDDKPRMPGLHPVPVAAATMSRARVRPEGTDAIDHRAKPAKHSLDVLVGLILGI